jgi:hypothetical protein
VIVVVVVITAPSAALPRRFQIVTFLFRLPAVFAMASNCVLQIAFCFSDVVFALIVTVNSVHRDHTTCQEKSSHQGYDNSLASDLLKHSSPSLTFRIGLAEAATGSPLYQSRATTACVQITCF